MKIAIDLRSLSSGSVSGVENYCLHLVDHLLAIDKKNEYTLFFNSWREQAFPEFHFVNSRTKKTKWPNKILNFSLKTRLVGLEKLIGPFDILFMPNLNQYNIKKTVKLALTVHDLSPIMIPEVYDIKRKLWHKFLNYKKSFARANVIFAVSEFTKNDLVNNFGLHENKIKVIYPGINGTKFNEHISVDKMREVRNTYSLPGDFILFLNTIEPRKNLSALIKAFELIKNDTYLIIAGKIGWKSRQIIDEITESKKFKKIKYLGYVDEADKAAIIKCARALVYPSIYEGFGFQDLEAMAVGTPVIASNVTALPEVTNGAALLVNPYDVLELAGALHQQLTNEQLRRDMIEKGKSRAKEFDWNKTAEQVLMALNNL